MIPLSSFLQVFSISSNISSVPVKYSPNGGNCSSSVRAIIWRISHIHESPDHILCRVELLFSSNSRGTLGIIISICRSSPNSYFWPIGLRRNLLSIIGAELSICRHDDCVIFDNDQVGPIRASTV